MIAVHDRAGSLARSVVNDHDRADDHNISLALLYKLSLAHSDQSFQSLRTFRHVAAAPRRPTAPVESLDADINAVKSSDCPW
jgi:hypothetical protein